MKEGIKHAIVCRCLDRRSERHSFIVHSVIVDNVVQTKFVQCDSCGIIHKVTEVGKSTIMNGKEHMASITSVDDVSQSLPERLVTILKSNNVQDLATWEQAAFILKNECWDEHVVVNVEVVDDDENVKFVRIISPNTFLVETEMRKIKA